MFKKKPQIKNLSPLRSSDRRKLADQIIADYQIPLPSQNADTIQSTPPIDPAADAASPLSLTLTSIRSGLLPENTSSARFTTTTGPNAIPVSGTVYVGTHLGQDERILWYSQGKDSRLIPTVYTLWSNPNIIPLLHTADFVVEDKLTTGADLMTPGLFKARAVRWDDRATKGSIVAVAGTSADTVPVWIGQCEIDVKDLPDDVRGSKGVAVKGLHWVGDEVWAWSGMGKEGRRAPDQINGWQGLSTGLDKEVQALDLQNDDNENGQEDGGVALEKSAGDLNGNPDSHRMEGQDVTETEDNQEPTMKEVDDAFVQAFLYSVHTAKKSNQAPNYGFDFPLQPSFLIANMIQPHLRFQNQHYNIKKTSWKNTKKFIKYLDKQVLIKSKDRNGGETVILDIDFNDQQITSFQPYKLPKPKQKEEPLKENGGAAGAMDGDSSLGQRLTIQNLYRASSRLVPQLVPSKTVFYTAQEITAALKAYIDSEPTLTSNVSVSRNIKLNPFIANNILGSNSSSSDQTALRAGEIDRGQLNRRILDDDHLCIPYHVVLRNDQTYNGDDQHSTTAIKPKPGSAPKVQITIEKRTGTKVVTKVSGLETYSINPQILAPELQKKCAGSASVGQLTGGKPGMMEIVVQGDQRDILVRDALAKRGVKSQWIDTVDKSKKGKSK